MCAVQNKWRAELADAAQPPLAPAGWPALRRTPAEVGRWPG